MTTVKEIAALINRIAPSSLAEQWDNCGLQVGSLDWEVRTIWTALDPSTAVVAAACAGNVDLLITHHPLCLSLPGSVDFERLPGRILKMAAAHRLSIYSAHTSYDSAAGGLNDICGRILGLKELKVLVPAEAQAFCKLAVFVPRTHEEQVLRALEGVGAGRYGDYSGCSFSISGTGRFRPLPGASPYIGRTGEITAVDEVRLEAIVETTELSKVLSAVRAAHPYEAMAYDVFPLIGGPEARQGLGRIGRLEEQMRLKDFGMYVRDRFVASDVRVAGDPDLPVRTVALCSGSGSGLMRAFLASQAEVYVSGDLKYHDAVNAVEAGRGLVDAGHFETEHPAVAALAETITRLAGEAGLAVTVEAYSQEISPFTRY